MQTINEWLSVVVLGSFFIIVLWRREVEISLSVFRSLRFLLFGDGELLECRTSSRNNINEKTSTIITETTLNSLDLILVLSDQFSVSNDC